MPRGRPVSKPEVVTETQTEGFTTARRTGGEKKETPTLFIESRPQIDVLDHGLDDYRFHHVWIDASNSTQFYSYYVDGYRFVPYDEVKATLESDDLRKHLYRETVDNRVAFGDSLRLMRIPMSQYLDRMQEGWGAVTGDGPAKRARESFQNQLAETSENINRTLDHDMKIRLNVDPTHGDKQITTAGGEE